MPELPADSREFINSEFARRLESRDPPTHDVLIETEPGESDRISQEITDIPGLRLAEAGSFGGTYIAAVVPQEQIPNLARVEGVVKVHQDQPTGVLSMPLRGSDLPFLTAENDPIRKSLSDVMFGLATPDTFGIGRVRMSEVEVPMFNFAQLPPGDPVEMLFAAADQIAGAGVSGEKLVPTSEAVKWIRDSDLTDGAVRPDTGVAIIDTGHTPTEPENGFRRPKLESHVPGEPPFDMMGHGSWCTNMVTGNPAPGVWGQTQGVAPGSDYGHFKALNTFPGFGKTSWILAAMTSALEWGADIISMSLGGAQQGPLEEDPYARFIRRNCKENAGDKDGAIFVVAAGNSGPGRYTIGSPGVAEKALTVGAWSLTDQAPSNFSSRGPQGTWYGDNPDRFSDDKGQYDTLEYIKPDVAAPGGGRENSVKASEEVELLFQSSTGWYDGLRDGFRDGRSNMKGTSMATPAVAGLVKRLYDAGIVKTAAEVKTVVRDRGGFPDFPQASEGANDSEEGKNITVGFGPIRESMFEPAGQE